MRGIGLAIAGLAVAAFGLISVVFNLPVIPFTIFLNDRLVHHAIIVGGFGLLGHCIIFYRNV